MRRPPRIWRGLDNPCNRLLDSALIGYNTVSRVTAARSIPRETAGVLASDVASFRLEHCPRIDRPQRPTGRVNDRNRGTS